MKKSITIIFAFVVLNVNAQIKTGIAMNLAQLPYQCFELNLLLANESKQFQILGAVNYTNGQVNMNNNRNVEAFDSRIMKSEKETIKGLGYGFEMRAGLNSQTDSKFRLLAGLGFNIYNYSVKFYNNEYVHTPPFHHYTLKEYNSNFVRKNATGSLIASLNHKFLIAEFGIGAAYSQANIPDELDQKRNFELSNFDYGNNGPSLVFSLRIGTYL